MTTGYITDYRPHTYRALYIKYKNKTNPPTNPPVNPIINPPVNPIIDPPVLSEMDMLMQRIESREKAARRKWLLLKPKRTNNYDIYSNKKSKCHRGKDWYGR